MHPLLPTRVAGNGLWLNGSWSKINVLRGRGMERAVLRSFALPHPSFTTSHGIANVFETSFMSPVYILNFQPSLRFVFAFIVFFYFSVHFRYFYLLFAFADILNFLPSRQFVVLYPEHAGDSAAGGSSRTCGMRACGCRLNRNLLNLPVDAPVVVTNFENSPAVC